MFKPFCSYQHVNTLDMNILVVKVSYAGPNYYKLRVIYVNRRTGDVYTTSPETIKIKRNDIKMWSRV